MTVISKTKNVLSHYEGAKATAQSPRQISQCMQLFKVIGLCVWPRDAGQPQPGHLSRSSVAAYAGASTDQQDIPGTCARNVILKIKPLFLQFGDLCKVHCYLFCCIDILASQVIIFESYSSAGCQPCDAGQPQPGRSSCSSVAARRRHEPASV